MNRGEDHGGLTQFDLGEHVGGPMLQGLETADLAAELLPFLQIGDGALEEFFESSERLGAGGRGTAIQRPFDQIRSFALFAE